MRANKLEPRKQFGEILGEVVGRGECIVDTGAVYYVLREGAVRELNRLAAILNDLSNAAPRQRDDEACEACARERSEQISRAVMLAGKGGIDDAKLLLQGIEPRDGSECAACDITLSRWMAPLLDYTFSLGVTDFIRRPFLTAAVKEPVDGEVMKEYRTPLGRVRSILDGDGELYYDPELPIDELSIRELSYLSRVKARMEDELLEDPSEALGSQDQRIVGRQRLLKLLDIYVNKLGDLQYIVADRELTDVYISPTGRVRVANRHGDVWLCTLRYTGEELERLASRLRSLSGKPFDHSNPTLSHFWEEENLRFSAVGYGGSCSSRPDLAVRLWPRKPWHIIDIMHHGSLTPRLGALLTVAANLGAGIIIGGDRGGGKSTLLQSFLFMIPKGSRKIALLTEREIHSWFLEQDFNITEFRVHPGKRVTSKGMPIDDAVKQLLIHGESAYLLMNEVKYAQEARPFFTMAAAAGISSLLTTMHADDARGVMQRLMIDFQLPLQALRNIDWVVTMGMVDHMVDEGRTRKLTEIVEIGDFNHDPIAEGSLNTIARYDPGSEEWMMPSLKELVQSSDFFNRCLMKRRMSILDIEMLIKALEMAYQRMQKSYPIPPEKFTLLMQHFFDSMRVWGSAEQIYESWWRKCSRLL